PARSQLSAAARLQPAPGAVAEAVRRRPAASAPPRGAVRAGDSRVRVRVRRSAVWLRRWPRRRGPARDRQQLSRHLALRADRRSGGAVLGARARAVSCLARARPPPSPRPRRRLRLSALVLA